MFCACCGRVEGGVAFTPDFDEDHWHGHHGRSRRRRRSTPAAGQSSVITKCLVLRSLRLAPSATMGSAFNIADRVACETVNVLSVAATGSHPSEPRILRSATIREPIAAASLPLCVFRRMRRQDFSITRRGDGKGIAAQRTPWA